MYVEFGICRACGQEVNIKPGAKVVMSHGWIQDRQPNHSGAEHPFWSECAGSLLPPEDE